ncbi:MAG: protein-L-isoaspartate(D-aspartate) O-methyltransferase [Deltaproteobacteria bacterium]|nr:protein-L-isoaspartate(D-aspartate) O-methyltransferase [Deltaproteobacteria bacterium]
MVQKQLAARGIHDKRVLAAMQRVKRHLFVPSHLRGLAHADRPLPIGQRQTISQPYIVAYMTEVLRVLPESKVLEIGTGSGYQAAVLGELAHVVYSIEIVPTLARRAKELLAKLQYSNIHVREGDGYAGWKEHAPFDRIILTAAPPKIPQPLLEQLAVGGILIAPVGVGVQKLVRIERTKMGFVRKQLLGVRFVPMTGRIQR